MKRVGDEAKESGLSQRRWAIARLALGQAQMMGATVTLYFLIQTGDSSLTFWSAGITACFTLTSRSLFRGRCNPRVKDKETPPTPILLSLLSTGYGLLIG